MKKIVIILMAFMPVLAGAQGGYKPEYKTVHFNDGVTFNGVDIIDSAIVILDTIIKFYSDGLELKTNAYNGGAGGGSLPSGSQGEMLYSNGVAWVALSQGASGYYLEGGTTPAWSNLITDVTNVPAVNLNTGFRINPSASIIAGDNIEWVGNTLNVTASGGGVTAADVDSIARLSTVGVMHDSVIDLYIGAIVVNWDSIYSVDQTLAEFVDSIAESKKDSVWQSITTSGITANDNEFITNKSNMPDTVSLWLDSNNDTVIVLTSNLLEINGHVYIEKYDIEAYIPRDSVLTTSVLSENWTFVGEGGNNKFVNDFAHGFSSEGDTIYFDKHDTDLRDSIRFELSWDAETSCNTATEVIGYAIFTKRIGDTDYTIKENTYRQALCKTADEQYSWAHSPMSLWLMDGEKIQIRVHASSATTITTHFNTRLIEN